MSLREVTPWTFQTRNYRSEIVTTDLISVSQITFRRVTTQKGHLKIVPNPDSLYLLESDTVSK